ncbi:MAG TPA: DUF2628 domain-containing protein [Xanthobacteraceae bacterium]|jgi:hypothetical protein|nr:DUF2628 domain-containing protein [Xanthobacteraceae bacterium]
MSVYTVHEPPPRRGAVAPEAERFVFVRDGFSLWALLLAPLWMLRHRMWLVLVGYIVIAAGLQIGVRVLGGWAPAGAAIGILLGLLVGLEAGTLRRFTLGRRGWKNIGVVSGDDVEDAERRFFDVWVQQRAAPASASTAATSPPARAPLAPVQRMPQAPAVVGLFPEPGAPR